jgi:hypothetical protein
MNKRPPIIAGIYGIFHDPSASVYVGQSTDIYIRWRDHKYNMRSGHSTPKLRELCSIVVNMDEFRFDILEEVTNTAHLLQRKNVTRSEWIF